MSSLGVLTHSPSFISQAITFPPVTSNVNASLQTLFLFVCQLWHHRKLQWNWQPFFLSSSFCLQANALDPAISLPHFSLYRSFYLFFSRWRAYSLFSLTKTAGIYLNERSSECDAEVSFRTYSMAAIVSRKQWQRNEESLGLMWRTAWKGLCQVKVSRSEFVDRRPCIGCVGFGKLEAGFPDWTLHWMHWMCWIGVVMWICKARPVNALWIRTVSRAPCRHPNHPHLTATEEQAFLLRGFPTYRWNPRVEDPQTATDF